MDKTFRQIVSEELQDAAIKDAQIHRTMSDKDAAHVRKVLAISMSELFKSHSEARRKRFLLAVTGETGTRHLGEMALRGLWHWCKPYQDNDGHWHINDRSATLIRAVVDEIERQEQDAFSFDAGPIEAPPVDREQARPPLSEEQFNRQRQVLRGVDLKQDWSLIE